MLSNSLAQLSLFNCWSMAFLPALLIVGPWKINTKSLRQTFGERFFKSHWAVEFSNEFESLSIAFATIQTHNQRALCEWCDHVSSRLRVVCVAGRYLEDAIDHQYFGVDFRSKQIWKRCCKKSVLHYNAIPSLNYWLPILQVWISGLLLIVWRLTSSHLFLALPGDLQQSETQVCSGAWRVVVVAQGNLGGRPLGSSPKNNPQL